MFKLIYCWIKIRWKLLEPEKLRFSNLLIIRILQLSYKIVLFRIKIVKKPFYCIKKNDNNIYTILFLLLFSNNKFYNQNKF